MRAGACTQNAPTSDTLAPPNTSRTDGQFEDVFSMGLGASRIAFLRSARLYLAA